MKVLTEIALVCVLFACVHAHGLQVITTEGVVEGNKAKDGDYYQFYGIPYAGPTDGENRFKGPMLPPSHGEIFYANNSNILCAQPSARGPIGVENCLVLNIFTKNVTAVNPVIVWLNAEDYTHTSIPKYSFKTFVEQNIVFVSLNFRLSIFGFLCLGVKEAPGNAGLRDVLQGLKWINSNIVRFGGDPNNVILMGHASGAAMVDLITMAPQAKGLVHKAIALSGSSMAPWAVAYDPVGYAMLVGATLGYTGNSKKDLAQSLARTDTSVLNTALVQFSDFRNNTPLFAPCVENISLNGTDTVLSDAPIHLLRSGNYLQIPYIAGYTSREGTMRLKEAVEGNWRQGMFDKFTDFLPADLDLTEDYAVYITQFKIGNHYFWDHQPEINMRNIDNYIKYQGDSLVAMPVIRGVEERSKSSSAEVRLLIFGYIGTNNSDWPYKQIQLNGVRHGGLLNFLFDYDLKPEDTNVMQDILGRFLLFARTGTQNSASVFTEWLTVTSSHLGSLQYIPYDEGNFTMFARETRDKLYDKTKAIWHEMYHWLYKAPKPVNYSNNSVGRIPINTFILILSSIFFMLCYL